MGVEGAMLTRILRVVEDEEWNKIISVNLTGMMYSLRAELRRIVDHGSIVNISSIQGLIGMLVLPSSLIGP